MKKIVIIVGVITIVLGGIIFRKNIQKLFLSPGQIAAICSSHTDHESCMKDSWCEEWEAFCDPKFPNCKNYVCHAKR